MEWIDVKSKLTWVTTILKSQVTKYNSNPQILKNNKLKYVSMLIAAISKASQRCLSMLTKYHLSSQ